MLALDAEDKDIREVDALHWNLHGKKTVLKF